MLIGILKGSVLFLADLVRSIDCGVEIDFIGISSYQGGTETSGRVRLLKDLDLDITGRDVLIVEDIVDSGLSLTYLRRYLQARGPRSTAVVTLLDKPAGRRTEVEVEYAGFRIPEAFVIGYGLDYEERFRGLPCVAVVEEGDLTDGRLAPEAEAALSCWAEM